MHRRDGVLVFSPTDLVGFLSCSHLTTLDLRAAGRAADAPVKDDPFLELLSRRGLDHERSYLDAIVAEGLTVVEIPGDANLAARAAATLDAMRAGADVIYQATFLDTDNAAHGYWWRGHADFLRRVPQSTAFGPWGYEPEDTKLARHVKPAAVLQLCNYADHVGRIQQSQPESIHVILGGGSRVTLFTRDFFAYYRRCRERLLAAVQHDASGGTYPQPVAHCAVCRWTDTCQEQWLVNDDLCLVANMRRDQARKLSAHGIATGGALAESAPGDRVPGMGIGPLDRLRVQAALQVQHRRNGPAAAPPYRLLDPAGPGIGLAGLPEPDDGDVFFDMEGDPFVDDQGIEYLFGYGWTEQDTFKYERHWAHSSAEEKRAFEAFIDFVLERRERFPRMHVYHYAPYEPTALGRLMGRHATRESELDALLRGGVLVDLYRVVRQSLIVGVQSYSIKKLEPLYMSRRGGVIADAGSSTVAYEHWLETGDQRLLDDIEVYNREDCISTWLLRDWLEERRAEAAGLFASVLPRPSLPGAEAHGEEPDLDLVVMLSHELVPEELDAPPFEAEDPLLRGRWLLGQLLDWHRREDKPEWWRFFDRVLRCTDEDLIEDSEAIAGLEYDGEVGVVKRSVIHRYRFDPEQEHKLIPGRDVCDPAVERARLGGEKRVGPGTLMDVDPVAGTLDLKRGASSAGTHPTALIPGGPLNTNAQRGALRRLARAVIDNGIDSEAGPYRAARDLLLRRPPRLVGQKGHGTALRRDEALLDAAIRCARGLNRSCLPIQGPPGSGKTWTAARMIVALVRDGHRVGITATSHAVISHVLEGVLDCAGREGVTLHALQKAEGDQRCNHPAAAFASTNEEVERALADRAVDVVAGTAWLFAREGMAELLDYLVIDEAGQISLANALAVATTAKNLILIGDPQQLAQPSTGSHPSGAELSALEHLLGGAATISGDRGLFLDVTHRMHPAICEFISETFYDGRLQALDQCSLQAIASGVLLEGSGPRWVPVDHTGNRTSSTEECAVVVDAVDALVGRAWTDARGKTSGLRAEDILVLAPYNAQIGLLARSLPPGVRVGTVDKFQGQESAVVFFSFAASSADDVPRGMEFLYSHNRLNVAISRARALSVVVGSPALLQVVCRSIRQMRLANAICRYAESAPTVPSQSSG